MTVSLYILGEKGYRSLQAAVEMHSGQLDTVVIGTDQSIHNDFSEASIQYCKDHNINHTLERETSVSSDYLLAIGWRWLIKTKPSQTLIVLHDSILPRYRGFNPLVTALINGDQEIGVTALLATEEYDRGDIIAVEKSSITYPMTISRAISIISEKYGVLVQRVLEHLKDGKLPVTPQKEEEATYSVWRDADDYFIDWNWDAETIERFVNAVGYPYLGAKAKANGEMYRVAKAIALPDVVVENRTPGKVIFKREGKLVVICGSGLLRLDEVYDSNDVPETFQNKFRIRFS